MTRNFAWPGKVDMEGDAWRGRWGASLHYFQLLGFVGDTCGCPVSFLFVLFSDLFLSAVY